MIYKMNIYDLLLENPIQGIEEEVKIGTRKGQDIICKIKPISNERLNEIRKMCTRLDKKKTVVDIYKFQSSLCVECTLEPNFSNADFIQKLGVATGIDALNKVLLPGEKEELYQRIQALCGYDIDMNEVIEEAKKQ